MPTIQFELTGIRRPEPVVQPHVTQECEDYWQEAQEATARLRDILTHLFALRERIGAGLAWLDAHDRQHHLYVRNMHRVNRLVGEEQRTEVLADHWKRVAWRCCCSAWHAYLHSPEQRALERLIGLRNGDDSPLALWRLLGLADRHAGAWPPDGREHWIPMRCPVTDWTIEDATG